MAVSPRSNRAATVSDPELIGAFGLHWLKEEVWGSGTYDPQHGWQLLGKVGANRTTLRVCDFRKAHGFYVLYNAYRPTYVGLARGRRGIGQRLDQHAKGGAKDWERFSWFAFDEVVDHPPHDGWSTLLERDATGGGADVHTVIGECEAMLIHLMGTGGQQGQSTMNLKGARPWTQIRMADAWENGVLHRVAREPLTWTWLKSLRDDSA